MASDVRSSLTRCQCHLGIMGGGHYVATARNPNGRWYHYDDSACKEARATPSTTTHHVVQVDADSVRAEKAYLLFYQARGLGAAHVAFCMHSPRQTPASSSPRACRAPPRPRSPAPPSPTTTMRRMPPTPRPAASWRSCAFDAAAPFFFQPCRAPSSRTRRLPLGLE